MATLCAHYANRFRHPHPAPSNSILHFHKRRGAQDLSFCSLKGFPFLIKSESSQPPIGTRNKIKLVMTGPTGPLKLLRSRTKLLRSLLNFLRKQSNLLRRRGVPAAQEPTDSMAREEQRITPRTLAWRVTRASRSLAKWANIGAVFDKDTTGDSAAPCRSTPPTIGG